MVCDIKGNIITSSISRLNDGGMEREGEKKSEVQAKPDKEEKSTLFRNILEYTKCKKVGARKWWEPEVKNTGSGSLDIPVLLVFLTLQIPVCPPNNLS